MKRWKAVLTAMALSAFLAAGTVLWISANLIRSVVNILQIL